MMSKNGFLRRAHRALCRQQDWNIGIVDAPVSAFADPAFRPEIRWLPDPPEGRFAADPFPFERSGATYLLYESYEFAREHGHIAAMRLAADGSIEHCGPVLSGDRHLSYPCVFTWNETLYCIPESCSADEIALYCLDRIPGSLTRVSTVASGVAAVDPTVFEHDGRWWLAHTDRRTGSNEALYLHHSATPLGPWKPHARNPVKCDSVSSRPAGVPFTADGILYRPAQDCSETYGGRIALNRVDRLTPTEFVEEIVRFIEPDRSGPRPHGLHTICGHGDITIVDGKRERFVAAAARAVLRRTFRKLIRRVLPAGREQQPDRLGARA